MKRAFLAAAAAVGLSLAILPAVAPATASATVYQTTSMDSYWSMDGKKWVKSYANSTTYTKKGLQTVSVDKSYVDGKLESTSKVKYKYGSKGRYASVTLYTNGKVASVDTYSYSGSTTTVKHKIAGKYTGKDVSKSTKQKTTTTSYDAKGKKTGQAVYKMDKKGNLTSAVEHKGKVLVFKQTATYKNGKITKSSYARYDETTGKLEYKNTCKYSYKGKYTIEKDYDDKGKPSSEYKYYLDKAGTRVYSYGKLYTDGKLYTTDTYKYKMYTSGKLKGIVKQEITISNGTPSNKVDYTVKAF